MPATVTSSHSMGKVYEFDTGSVIQMLAANGSQIADGALLTITDNQPFPVTRIFEFDKNGTSGPGHVRISINNGMQTQTLMTQIVNAINGVAGFAVTAESLPNSNRITLRGESDITGAESTSLRVAILGAPGISGGADVGIAIEETSDLDEYGTALVSLFDGTDGVTAGWDGQRVNFSGAGDGDFTPMVTRGVFVDMGSDGAALHRCEHSDPGAGHGAGFGGQSRAGDPVDDPGHGNGH